MTRNDASLGPRILRPGEDYSLWPHLKWAHARQLASQFTQSVELYSTSTTKGLTAQFSGDRRTVTFCARIAHTAPVYEWSLLIGDIVHNYRSALDALAWEAAHLDGRRPHTRHEKQIYFPICTSRSMWTKQVNGPLSSVPPDILERFHSVQPYPVEPAEDGIFVFLNEMDIADKHKGLLRADVIARDKHHIRFKAELENGEDYFLHAEDPPWEWIAGTAPVRDGDPIFRLRSKVPMTSAECDMALPVAIAVSLRGNLHDIFGLLEMIDLQVALTFEMVETGRWADAPADLRPVPVDYSDEVSQ